MASDTSTELTAPDPSDADGPVEGTGGAGRQPRSWTTGAWLVPVLLLGVAAAVRLYRLGYPEDIFFDEVYYVGDARSLLDLGVEEGFAVHPPLGKWLIAMGMRMFGDSPFGWRVAVAAAGTLTVLAVYAAGLRLFRRRGPAALAALLVAVDGLALAMSRIAMLDAFLALFVTVAFWLLLVDRDRQWEGVGGAPPPDGGRPLPRRPHHARWLAGLVLGIALATKWSALLAIGAAGLFVLGSELAFRRRTTGRALAHWSRAATSALLTLLALPALIYVLSYAGWFTAYEHTRPGQDRCPDPTACSVPLPERAGDWVEEQRAIARFHGRLDAEHPYRSRAVTWPLLLRPVAYHYESCTPTRRAELRAEGEDCLVAQNHVSHVLGVGNPAVWWLALLAHPVLLWMAFRRRDWRALAIAAFLLGQYVPWLLATRPLFLFYMTPVVPFIALSLAYATEQARRAPLLRWVPGVVALVAVSGFVFWFPLWTGLEIPHEAWRFRIWHSGWI